jgi:hypothetical protein
MSAEKIMIVALAVLAGMIVNRMMNVDRMLANVAA